MITVMGLTTKEYSEQRDTNKTLAGTIRSRGNSGQYNDYATGWKVRGSNASKDKSIYLLQIVHPGPEYHPASYSIVTEVKETGV
jgi:hypothetical protein